MSIWFILLILLVVATIITATLAKNEKGVLFAVLTYIQMLLCTLCLVIAIAFPISAKKDILAFKVTSEAVNLLGPIVGYDNFTDEITKANEWLVEANKNLHTYGAFSKYFNTELPELKLIVIPEE